MLNLSDFGILISAIGGIIIIYEKIFERRDRFVVSFGSYRPEMDARDSMFIVSKSFQPLSIRNYGFIKKNGSLESIFWIGECASDCDNYDIERRGSSEHMEYNQVFELKCYTSEEVIGAFALGASQKFPRLSFSCNARIAQRLSLRFKIMWHTINPSIDC